MSTVRKALRGGWPTLRRMEPMRREPGASILFDDPTFTVVQVSSRTNDGPTERRVELVITQGQVELSTKVDPRELAQDLLAGAEWAEGADA